MADSSEDDPTSPPKWRSPCPCTLSAHEACLLEWLADKELSPSKASQDLRCPQCKSEIKIARPESRLLSIVKEWQRIVSELTMPAAAVVFATPVLLGLYHHGLWSVQLVFGKKEAGEILRQAQLHYGWQIGYGVIPIYLIAARTGFNRWLIPITEACLLSRRLSLHQPWDIHPLGATEVFLCLPLFQVIYDGLFKEVSRRLQRRWMGGSQLDREGPVEPPNNQDADQDADEHVHFELNIEIGMDDDEAPEHLHQMEDRQEAEMQNDVQAPNGAQDPEPPRAGHEPLQVGGPGNLQGAQPARDGNQQAEGNRPAAARAEANPWNGNRNDIVIEGSSLFRTLFGGLMFPAIASAMGGLLDLSLPTSLTRTKTHFPFTFLGDHSKKGLLQTQWGRAVVGGCLFVVAKDALTLLVKWRMAQNFRERRVLEWVGQRGRDAKGEYVLKD